MEYIHSMTFWGIKDFPLLSSFSWRSSGSSSIRKTQTAKLSLVWEKLLVKNGSSSQLLETLPLPNIKWICPTAPTRSMALLGSFTCTTWFDVRELLEEGPDDWEGLDASAAHIANLLSTEPVDVGIGGFNMGAAIALYSATCYAMGGYGNGNPYPVNLRAVIGLSGWLLGSRNESFYRVLYLMLKVNYLVRTLSMMVRKACSLLVHLLKTNWSSHFEKGETTVHCSGHYIVVIQTLVCYEHCFLLIIRIHLDLVIRSRRL
ncbi:hypothetical protein UlMin_042729 [Ulmus minor]